MVDLAKAHAVACNRLLHKKNENPFEVFNIGTGKGSYVFEIIRAFEQTTGIKVNYTIGPRRDGDAPEVYATTTKANTIPGWKATLHLQEMIASAWQRQLQLDKK